MLSRIRARIRAARRRAAAWRRILAKRIRQLQEALRRKREREHAPRYGCDWAYGSISPASLKAARKDFACRYLSPESAKNLTPAEARANSAAGIDNVVVWESTGNRAAEGYAAGVSDAQEALRQANACGKPRNAPIFFAIDFEARGPDVDAYFRGVSNVLGVKRTGAYGGRAALAYLFALKRIGAGWQTYAWSGGQWLPQAHLRQYLNGSNIAGVEVDLDEATHPDYGGW